MKRVISVLALGPVLVALTAPAAAQTAYSVDRDTDDLYEIDLSTGNATSLGATGFNNIEALAFDPTGKVLYGVDEDNGELLKCDLADGSCAAVGSTGLSDADDTGLGFTCDGRLWMVAVIGLAYQLHEVDPTTGNASLVGDLDQNLSSLAIRRGDSICPSGVFGLDESNPDLWCVDLSTGALSLIGATDDLSSNGDPAIEFDGAGVLWAIEDNDSPPGIFTINPATGADTYTGNDLPSNEFESLAIPSLPQLCGGPLAIPAASGWGLSALAFLLVAAGVLILRRSVA